jgi:glutathione S-transferase
MREPGNATARSGSAKLAGAAAAVTRNASQCGNQSTIAEAWRMHYRLYYWPGIQGRGEFVRLALEAASARYTDVAREPQRGGGGVPALLHLIEDAPLARPPFAPPILGAGRLLIAQTANILQYLGPRLGLVPGDEASRLWAHQLQLTVTDFLAEVHDVHHPIAVSLYYRQQKTEARRRARYFTRERMPKFLGYFERAVQANRRGRGYTVGNALSYVDLSMFQLVGGLRHAFPRHLRRLERQLPGLVALHDRVAELPRVAAYLRSERRIRFNESGIFRHYPELDGART